MYKNLIVLVWILISSIVSGQKDSFRLSQLNDKLLSDIIKQGSENFARSEYYVKNEVYITIPEFTTVFDGKLEKLRTISSEDLLNKLSFKRKRKSGLLKDIGWYIFLKRNSCVSCNSDFKTFYCYSPNSLQRALNKFETISPANVNYVFYIGFFNLNYKFIVDNVEAVKVYNSTTEELLTYVEFQKEIKDYRFLEPVQDFEETYKNLE